MARFVFASTPVAAHSATPRPIVRRLVERGHEVVWYAGEAFAAGVRASGATWEPFIEALDFSVGDPYDHFPHLRALSGLGAIKAVFQDVFLAQIEPNVADLEEIVARHPSDVVVTDILLGRAANIVHERGGPVHAILNDGALSPPHPQCPPWGRGLLPWRGPLNGLRNRALLRAQRFLLRDLDAEYAAIRARLGLGPDPRFVFDAGASDFLHLQGTVPEFEYPHPHLPAPVHFVGAFRPDPPPSWTPPDWWDEVGADGRPVVHLTQGTLRADPDELFRPAVEALADEDVLVVATTGAVAPDALDPVPANVRRTPFIPYDALLARADVFVTNGGYVGTNLALSHGVPLVLVGATEDKAEIGARVTWTGVGRALRTVRPTPEAIRSAVRAVLADPRYRQRAQAVQRSMATRDATTLSVDLLERLAATRTPVMTAAALV